MSMKKIAIAAAILVLFVIVLFMFPSVNQSVGAEQSSFAGYGKHSMTLPDAIGLTKVYRFTNASDVVLSHYLGKGAFEKVLAQPGCVGLRVYYGKNKDGSPVYVIVGVDKTGNDIVSSAFSLLTKICPPYCGE